MAHHLSAKKRIRQNIKRNARNRQYRTYMRTRIKKLRLLIADGKKEEAVALLPKVILYRNYHFLPLIGIF